MNCKKGGFIIMRHNNVRDFEANLLKTVVNDVEKKKLNHHYKNLKMKK